MRSKPPRNLFHGVLSEGSQPSEAHVSERSLHTLPLEEGREVYRFLPFFLFFLPQSSILPFRPISNFELPFSFVNPWHQQLAIAGKWKSSKGATVIPLIDRVCGLVFVDNRVTRHICEVVSGAMDH